MVPSVSMTQGRVHVAWATGVHYDQLSELNYIYAPEPSILISDFNYDDDPATWPRITYFNPEHNWDTSPSTGLSSLAVNVKSLAWARDKFYLAPPSAKEGLLVNPPATLAIVRDCLSSILCANRRDQFQPCLAMRNDGYFVVAYAHDEVQSSTSSPFDIHLQLIDPAGQPIGAGVKVNDLTIEIPSSTQNSPAVAFDDAGNIVVVWSGRALNTCAGSSDVELRRIFARRFRWPPANGNTSAAPEPLSAPFIVNNDPSFDPRLIGNQKFIEPNPSVALSRANNGRWVVVWNAVPAASIVQEVHAQYFDAVRPVGGEFRVNQDNTGTIEGRGVRRCLGQSAQHTVAYGVNDEAVVVWTQAQQLDASTFIEDVFFTMLPSGFAGYQATVQECCKGDMNGSGGVTVADLPLFVEFLLTGAVQTLKCESLVTLSCVADTNSDGAVNGDDIQSFVSRILAAATCTGQSRQMLDCNANEIPDANDIADGTSLDCNNNFIPDECDIAAETSADVNTNGIPDECEKDCNENGRPDDSDVLCGGGNTCNGIAGSYDCNLDGTPDECEADCNANVVPDDCDIDPTDPDGDTFVSDDCNGDGMPDECNLTLPPPFGSFDCNENGTLDECDIASEFSEDANENGVPDECDESGLFGGEAMMSGPEQFPVDDEAAWEAFAEWSFTQCWGPDCELSPSEQFHAYVNKLAELGLTMP